MSVNCFTLPAKPPHLADIVEVRKLYAKQTGRSAVRQTVNKWLVRRNIPARGPNPHQRLFDRSAVKCALALDFPAAPKFISVKAAFALAHRPYPKASSPYESQFTAAA